MRRVWAAAILLCVAARLAPAQIGGEPGAYSRMGFGARGAGMGNAMTAVTGGDISAYYNPALLPYTEYRFATAAFGVLSLDRRLNFLGYGQALPPNAGISAGIINAGVSDIDGRDAEGVQTGALKTSENQAFLGFGLQMKSGWSIGINVKFLYYHLYTDMTSTTAGIDLGALVPVGSSVTIGFTVRDLLSKYKWDSSPVYGSLQGSSVSDEFPERYTLGAAWRLPDSLGIVAADLELTNRSTRTLRLGVEVPLIPEVTVRAGIDRIDLKEKGNGVAPAFGFTLRRPLEGIVPALHYAYVIEPFAPSGMHLISIAAEF